MKKLLLSLSLFVMALMAGAQEPTLKARSVYDVNQDDKVTVQDVTSVTGKLLGKVDDKTAVDTQSLLDVLNTLKQQYDKIIEMLSANNDRFINVENKLGVGVGRHEYVDLGLSVLWATCNVGAENPEDLGLYFAWGETKGYKSTEGHDFQWSNYKWSDPNFEGGSMVTKYTFEDGSTDGCWYKDGVYVGTTVDGVLYKNLTELLPEDDAATQNWHYGWRMPSNAEFDELLNNCTLENVMDGDVFKGLKFISKVPGYEGNSIFLPAGGHIWGTDNWYWFFCSYWSSTIAMESGSYQAYGLYYNVLAGEGEEVLSRIENRACGQFVRPVCPKN